MVLGWLLAVVLFETQQGGVGLSVESEMRTVDPARSVFVQVALKVPRGKSAQLPDLRDRVKGFSLAEDFAEPPKTEADGTTVQVANWRLVPEPCAEEYKIRPFAVLVDGGRSSFVGGPVYFEKPAAREPVTGTMEANPTKDLPPFSWKLVGWIVAALAAAAGIVAALVALLKFVAGRIREHRMSPIERAWVELDRLLKKGLPGRGRYKDFYVELTMVVRRYIQRKYGIKAPHLTTEEFLAEIGRGDSAAAGAPACSRENRESLRRFLESADLVKFAGVEATPEMADGATESARGYLQSDSKDTAARAAQEGVSR